MKLILILFLFLLKYINAIEYSIVDDYNLNRYPVLTTSNVCQYDFKVWISDSSGILVDSITSTGNPHYIIGSNSTHVLYSQTLQLSGSLDIVISATSGNSQQKTYTLSCICNVLQSEQIDFQPVGQIYFDPFTSFSLIVKRVGVPSYSSIPITINTFSGSETILQDGIHSQISIPFYAMPAITSQIKIDFQYDIGLFKSIYVSNYFNVQYNSSFKLIYYPMQVNNSLLLMGKELAPSFTFSVSSQDIKPLYSYAMDSTSNQNLPIYRAIYEANGTTTYLSTFYYSTMSLNYDFYFYAQVLNQKELVYTQDASLIDAPYTVLSTSSGTPVVTNEAILLNIDIYSPPDQIYQLNRIIISTHSLNKNIEAPFGFGPSGGNNKNYQFSITIPYFNRIFNAQYYIFSQLSSTSVISNGDDPLLYVKPEILSYQFEFITNSQYIFKVTIQSLLCGVTGITFDATEYKRISQYRVSGSSFNGYYEIPIDFKVSAFVQIGLLDLCNNEMIYKNNDIIISTLTPLNIPFINNWKNVDLSSIESVSFLYNNIDVSKDSVSNVIYFNYPNYDIKNAPIAFRIPYYEYKTSVILFTREYYGKWNSTIGKFQIEFIVPKNSRSGKFDYLITLGLGSGDNSNYIASSSLSNDAQLYIANSNFDGIGPIITSIKKELVANSIFFNTLKWRLTISDPINGFDYGHIKVMGSLDNSIYKFDLTPSDLVEGDAKEGIYYIIVNLVQDMSCVNQDYIITRIILYDTAGQKTHFERDLSDFEQYHPTLNNPLYLLADDPSLITISVTCSSNSIDATPPTILFTPPDIISLDVGSNSRVVTFKITATDNDSGINYFAQGPIVYLIAENFEVIECISILVQHTAYTADYSCSLEVPVGFGSEFGKIYVSVYNVINNHGLTKGYSSSMLNLNIPVIYTSSEILLLESGLASSKGGDFSFSGKNFNLAQGVYINYTESNTLYYIQFSDFQIYGTSVISISNLKPTKAAFYVYVESTQGSISNQLLVNPVIYNDYIPTITVPPTIAPTTTPLPTNAPQQCKGSPVCGGPTNGYCDNSLGCKCYSPWIGLDCLSKVIEIPKPILNSTQPSTEIKINNNSTNNNSSSSNNNIQFKSLVSIYSLREIGIDGDILNEYPLYNQTWLLDSNNSDYLTNITNKNNNEPTQILVRLEWFNSSKTITFANQDILMNPNSMKYTIEISNYQFKSKLSRLQLVISALFSSTGSNDLCSFKEFGETSTGDNSNYLKIQIGNKSLYIRAIKRAIIDESRVISIENTLLDNSMNTIETSSETQSYIGINIPAFDDKVIIDPDISVLLDSRSVDKSYSNSKCPNNSKSLSKSQIAGIIVGGVVLIVIIVLLSLIVISKSFKYKSNSLLKLHMKVRSIYNK